MIGCVGVIFVENIFSVIMNCLLTKALKVCKKAQLFVISHETVYKMHKPGLENGGFSASLLEGWCTYKGEKLCYNEAKEKEDTKMARKRMFSIPLIESDEFCKFPASTQAIYLHLNMNADDDGVVDNWQSVIKSINSKRNFLDPLIEKGYIIMLKCGALLIADWCENNSIRQDRYICSRHIRELDEFFLMPNGRYCKKNVR